MEMSGATRDGSWRENIPSGELVSTMLTLVWAIAGVCKWEVSGAERSERRRGLRDRICRETC